MVFQPLKRGETISSVSIFDHPTVQMNHTSVVPTSTFTQLLPEPLAKKTPTQLDEYTFENHPIRRAFWQSKTVSSKHSPQVLASQAHRAHFPHKSSQVRSQSRDSSQSEHQSHPPVSMAIGFKSARWGVRTESG